MSHKKIKEISNSLQKNFFLFFKNSFIFKMFLFQQQTKKLRF